ncbi:MAG: MATE family efflux transporter [Spirochaetaceae bacterium]|nr:MAG: MATE family efflux transporter [Spirochaetaceae bacterium]
MTFYSRWNDRGGFAEVLRLAAPLILSTGSLAVQEFIDRMFLSWYSPQAIAASMPSGILYFTILSLFLGTASYVNTFVAQYHGAAQPGRIGPALWQGFYVSLAGGLLIVLLAPLSTPLFNWIGHPPEVRLLEARYFRVLCYGSIFPIANSAVSSFFTGRGKPWPVMWVHMLATALNIVLNYLLIFGRYGFPELGITGAAISTVLSGVVSFLVFCVLILRRKHNQLYATASGWRPNPELMARILRFGIPSGVQFFIDIFGFTVFILLIGRIGMVELAATNIAFNINSLAFMPMIGLGMAVSILVGQYVGEGRVELASRSTYSGFAICIIYMGIIALSYLLVPDFYIGFFAAKSAPGTFEDIRRTAVVLLRFVAVYSIFDTMNIVFASGIKGAGDTRFVMIMILIMSTGILVVPTFLSLIVFRAGIYTAWIFVTAYVIVLGFGFLLRFLQGKWKSMRVI